MAIDFQSNTLESQIRELYARLVWSHKTQEKCADIIFRRNNRIKIVLIGLSALTTTGILVTVFGNNKTVGIISAVLSAILFGLNTYLKDYDLGGIAQKHANSASDLWNMRELYLSLLTDVKIGRLTPNEITIKRDTLQDELYHIYKGSPRTISKAYKEATLGLKAKEEMYFTDDEIDTLLPANLRKLI